MSVSPGLTGFVGKLRKGGSSRNTRPSSHGTPGTAHPTQKVTTRSSDKVRVLHQLRNLMWLLLSDGPMVHSFGQVVNGYVLHSGEGRQSHNFFSLRHVLDGPH